MQSTTDLPLGVIEPEHEFQSAEVAAEVGRALERAGVAAGNVAGQGGLRSTARGDVEGYLDDLAHLAEAAFTWTSVSPPHLSRRA
jgi:hypothetical protein